MRAVDLIRTKRDGGTLSPEEIRFFVNGVTAGAFPDYQTSALLMAICLQGMSAEETLTLTHAMTKSGVTLDFSGVPGVKVDKHSTGGVGDKTSLVVAPLAAACGVIVPMMSGRGLGHTGGTIDKLESIPGLRTDLSIGEVRAELESIGFTMIGQSQGLVPADRTLYALRDVTGSVESIPLISASIMSKKIAEGIDALVMDVKCGSGAFMKTPDQARELAETLVAIGQSAGLRTQALMTAMDAPLGRSVGNAVEVIESIETLKGRGPADLEALSISLTAWMVRLAEIEPDLAAAEERVRAALASGAGLEKFRAMVQWQGGDPHVVDDYGQFPQAGHRDVVRAGRTGYLASLDAHRIGHAIEMSGAGRDVVGGPIDHAAGGAVRVKPGEPVHEGDVVLEVLHSGGPRVFDALAVLRDAVVISDDPPRLPPLVLATVP